MATVNPWGSGQPWSQCWIWIYVGTCGSGTPPVPVRGPYMAAHAVASHVCIGCTAPTCEKYTFDSQGAQSRCRYLRLTVRTCWQSNDSGQLFTFGSSNDGQGELAEYSCHFIRQQRCSVTLWSRYK